jgi:hypothetical protein
MEQNECDNFVRSNIVAGDVLSELVLMENDRIHSVFCKRLEIIGMATRNYGDRYSLYSNVLLGSRIYLVAVHTKSYYNYL